MFKKITAIVLFVVLFLSTIGAQAAKTYDLSDTSLSVVEERAFYGNTSLTTIVLPEETSEIQDEAFVGCTSLTRVVCLSRTVTISDTAFDDNANLIIECLIGSTFDTFARENGLECVYIDAFTLECNTVNNGYVGLPITWTVDNVMPSVNIESVFVYKLYKDGKLLSTSDETADKQYVYTPTAAGKYHVSATIKNYLTTTEIASAKVNVAATIYMGTFEQDKNQSTSDPVEWQIITVDGDRALLISKYILRVNSYFNPYWLKYKYCYWKGSIIGTAERVNYLGNTDGKRVSITPTTIPLKDGSKGTDDDLFYTHCRYWCNETFYKNAFTIEEKSRIQLTNNVNPDSHTKVDGGPNTDDYVFFLSNKEINEYWPDKADRKTSLTPVARTQLDSGKPIRYWLRTNGEYRVNAMFVYATSGSVYQFGSDVGHDTIGYRPAMWITIGG